jgi:hypothetical protein
VGQLPVGVKRVWLDDSEVLGLVVAGLRRRDSLGHRSIKGQERKKMVVEDKRCVRLFGIVLNRLLASGFAALYRLKEMTICGNLFPCSFSPNMVVKKGRKRVIFWFSVRKMGLGPLSRTRRVLDVSSVYLVVLQ